MKAILKQYMASFPWGIAAICMGTLFVLEGWIQDTVSTGSVSVSGILMLSGSGGWMRYVISPQNGIILYVPIFFLLERILLEREKTGDIYLKIRLPIRLYRWRPILFGCLTGIGYTLGILLCASKGILTGSIYSKGLCPMELLCAATAAKCIYFIVLSLLTRLLAKAGVGNTAACGIVCLSCVGDYIASYTRGYRRGILFMYAFSEMESTKAWISLFGWLLISALLLWFMQMRKKQVL